MLPPTGLAAIWVCKTASPSAYGQVSQVQLLARVTSKHGLPCAISAGKAHGGLLCTLTPAHRQ